MRGEGRYVWCVVPEMHMRGMLVMLRRGIWRLMRTHAPCVRTCQNGFRLLAQLGNFQKYFCACKVLNIYCLHAYFLPIFGC